MVLDPINVNARFIAKTERYDPESVMNWPFFEEIASRHKPIGSDSDYKTELSQQDKEFIKSLYGDPFDNPIKLERYFPLIEMNLNGTGARFSMETNCRLVVIWDETKKYYTYLDLPEAASNTAYSTVSAHKTFESGPRKITIAEVLAPDQDMPKTSMALNTFSFNAAGVENIDVKYCNLALSQINISGGPANLYFANNYSLKNLFFSWTEGSTVKVENCPLLEVISNISYTTPEQFENISMPPLNYSLGDETGKGLEIVNCRKVKRICLDRTQIKELDLSGLPELEYVYLASFPDYIVGGGEPAGQYLIDLFNSLPMKTSYSRGIICLRGIQYEWHQIPQPGEIGDIKKWYADYKEFPIHPTVLDSIQTIAKNRYWLIAFNPGYYLWQ